MAILPYMYQLPSDYYKKNYATPEETTPPPPAFVPPPVLPVDTLAEPITPAYQVGGAWVGTSPPANPAYGWLWLNSNNNGLYVFGDPSPGVWTQVGTNW